MYTHTKVMGMYMYLLSIGMYMYTLSCKTEAQLVYYNTIHTLHL